MADTLTTNISASYAAMVERTIAQMPQSAPMLSLARKLIVPKGSNSAQIPRVSSVSSVQTPGEGDELNTTSRFTLASNTISPTFRAIYVRIHVRAINYSQEDLVRLVSDEMALSQGQDIDTDLTGEFANWHTDNDIGATGEKLTLAKLREARRTLQSVPRAKGGPPRGRRRHSPLPDCGGTRARGHRRERRRLGFQLDSSRYLRADDSPFPCLRDSADGHRGVRRRLHGR